MNMPEGFKIFQYIQKKSPVRGPGIYISTSNVCFSKAAYNGLEFKDFDNIVIMQSESDEKKFAISKTEEKTGLTVRAVMSGNALHCYIKAPGLLHEIRKLAGLEGHDAGIVDGEIKDNVLYIDINNIDRRVRLIRARIPEEEAKRDD